MTAGLLFVDVSHGGSADVDIFFFQAESNYSRAVGDSRGWFSQRRPAWVRFARVTPHYADQAIRLLIAVNVLARSYLIVESFVALPNSPASVYQSPRWTVYVPHI